MQTHSTSTAETAMIKLPYANAQPSNDLADVISILRVVLEIMGDGRGMNAEFCMDIHATISTAVERIKPVFRLLDTLDLTEEYRTSRMAALTCETGC